LSGGVRRLSVPIDLALVPSEFDRSVLRRLYGLRTGQTVFYAELAAMVGRPGAARAVGGAMRRNPIPIVVPCHRVLPRTGGLGSYTGGVDKKAWLLAREGLTFEKDA
jgi:methylated-DNA-[protein]-cysteine S-methyltransferase